MPSPRKPRGVPGGISSWDRSLSSHQRPLEPIPLRRNHMRLPLIAPADLTPEQRPVYDEMRAGIEKNFQGFKTIAKNGALMGPWNPWLHEPKFGKPIWELTLALSVLPSLPGTVREVAI